MRITNKMMQRDLLENLNRTKQDYYRKQMEISSEKKLFNPSDNPVGYNTAANKTFDKSSYDEYLNNMKLGEQRLLTTENSLDRLQEILVEVKQLTELNATESSTIEDREIAAEQIENHISQALEIANTRINGQYIFSGYKTSTRPFSDTGKILKPYAHQDNTYQGTLGTTGEFSGTENKEYLVDIVSGGALNVATYRVSEDGGTTWGTTQTTSTSIDLFDDNSSSDSNVDLTLTPGTFETGDQFKVNIVPGKYNGDSGEIKLHSNYNSTVKTNLNGEELFEENDFFGNLNDIKIALENDDTNAISNGLQKLEDNQNIFSKKIGELGMNLFRCNVNENNLEIISDKLLGEIQEIEKPDLADALVEFTELENRLNTSLSTLSKIFPKSLLNFI